MDQTIYHVLLEGRKVGPYDRRTIVGMRIKNTLTSEDVLVAADGARLTVAALIGQHPPSSSFSPERSGSFSVVQATFAAALLGVEGKGFNVPAFKGEVELRVQAGVLRIAGRFRRGLGWKEDRVKLVLKDVVHARIKGSQIELWLKVSAGPPPALQRVALELFSHEAAVELVEWLPGATPWPESAERAVAAKPGINMFWIAAAGLSVVVVLVVVVLMMLMQRRMY